MLTPTDTVTTAGRNYFPVAVREGGDESSDDEEAGLHKHNKQNLNCNCIDGEYRTISEHKTKKNVGEVTNTNETTVRCDDATHAWCKPQQRPRPHLRPQQPIRSQLGPQQLQLTNSDSQEFGILKSQRWARLMRDCDDEAIRDVDARGDTREEDWCGILSNTNAMAIAHSRAPSTLPIAITQRVPCALAEAHPLWMANCLTARPQLFPLLVLAQAARVAVVWGRRGWVGCPPLRAPNGEIAGSETPREKCFSQVSFFPERLVAVRVHARAPPGL